MRMENSPKKWTFYRKVGNTPPHPSSYYNSYKIQNILFIKKIVKKVEILIKVEDSHACYMVISVC